MTERPDTHTLIGAYALDAVDAQERQAFERHLAGCEACRDEVAGLRRTVVRLADAAASAPPARVREHVLAQTRTTPQVRDADIPLPQVGGTPAGRSRVWLAAAAVLAVLTVGAGALAWTQYRAADAARAEAARISAVVTDPGARLVQERLGDGATATAVVAGSRAVVAGAGMPALASDRTYQLWVIRGTRITSAGLGPGGSEGSGRWSRLVEGVRAGDVIAVSVEPSGGSAQPTTAPLVTLRT